jgi:AraC-like DNA-binding protein
LPAPNAYINFIQLMAVFFIAYYSLKQKEIYPVDEKQRSELIAFNEEPLPDSKRKIVPDEEIPILKQQLTSLMIEQKPYLDSELNLVKLADLLSISSHQLSYLINTGFNENFFQYINKFRVEKAKDLLRSSEKDNLTILGIAFESGFNSKTSFNTTFKKITNQTPSEFKKNSAEL